MDVAAMDEGAGGRMPPGERGREGKDAQPFQATAAFSPGRLATER